MGCARVATATAEEGAFQCVEGWGMPLPGGVCHSRTRSNASVRIRPRVGRLRPGGGKEPEFGRTEIRSRSKPRDKLHRTRHTIRQSEPASWPKAAPLRCPGVRPGAAPHLLAWRDSSQARLPERSPLWLDETQGRLAPNLGVSISGEARDRQVFGKKAL